MERSGLRNLLDKEAGDRNINFLIPHPFLPPRYRKIAEGRNMLVLLDRDLTMHVRWEGAHKHEHLPLTKRQCTRLLRECLRSMSRYRREVSIFSRFIERWGEEPFDDNRYEAPRIIRELPDGLRKVETRKAPAKTPVKITAEMGGESPMPWSEFDE